MRRLLAELMDLEDVNRLLVEKVTAIGVRYDVGAGRPAAGRPSDRTTAPAPVPGDRPVSRTTCSADASGTCRWHGDASTSCMHDGRGLLLDRTGALSVTGWADRVDHVVDGSEELDVPAVLLRPDGHVVWVGDDRESLVRTLLTWFGDRA